MKRAVLIDSIYSISNWILRFLYIHLLWMVFSLLGLVIFGVFPATVSLFAVTRKWLLGETDLPIFATFLSVFKQEFMKSNLLGILLSFGGLVLYADLLALQHTSIPFLQYLYFPVLFIALLYACSILHFFSIYVHYELKGLHIIKNALLFTLAMPLAGLKLVGGLLVIVYLFITFPGSIILFGASVPAFYMMWISLKTFTQYEQKRAGK